MEEESLKRTDPALPLSKGELEGVNKPIFLVGFMGSGKTTWGKRVAKKLGLAFFDTDSVIETLAGKSVSEIFSEDGEATFRQFESEVIDSFNGKPCVVATGGGLPCFGQNMQKLNEFGLAVYLNLPEQALFYRLRQERGKRPLIVNLTDEELKTFVHTKLEEREAIYLQAKVVVNVMKADVNSLVEHLRELGIRSLRIRN